MAVTVRTETVKQMCQRHDTVHKGRKAPATVVPASWKLTPQQQAFIDVFAEYEPKKKYFSFLLNDALGLNNDYAPLYSLINTHQQYRTEDLPRNV